MAGVEEGWQARLGDHLVERVGAAVVREEGLEVRVELEALDAVVGDQRSGARDRVRPGRVDARERDHDVRVRGRGLGDLLVRDRGNAAPGLPVDGEDDGCDAARAVVRRDVVDRRQRLVASEVPPRRLAQVGGHRIVAVPRELRVDVHVDRGDGRQVDHGDTVPSFSWSAAPHASRSQSAPGAPMRETLTGSPLWLPTPDGSATTGNPVQSQ